ncbi:MAG TPA: S9 family peptidase, partial [Candidatus Baltobacteraceae bacterium]|nr:S9 family peptidase [Candidatus Baltobacteraceae bacterium]
GMPETSFISDIFAVPASGGEPRMVTRSLGPIGFPAFSHDGREIACIGHERGDNGSLYNAELLVVPVAGGPVRSLSAALDRSVSDQVICDVRGAGGAQAPIWSAGDRELFVLLSSEGSTGIAAFPRDGSAHHLVAGGERDIFAFSRAEDGTLALVYSSPTVPSDIALIDPYGSEQRLTTSNPWLDECALRVPRRMRPLAADGQMLDGWLLEPAGAQPAPYVLEVHGGPHYGYGYAFFFEFQVLAAHGIGVAYGNPRGSQGYGLAYADAITGDWGGVDASDVLTLLDGALANAQVDSARVAIAGGSYGGFMTTWLLGHSKRFAAGVSMRAVNDFVSEVGASDLGWFLEPSLRAPWFEDAGRKLFEGSPMRNATHIEAPLLILHSERDYRCPIDQGEGLFTLLRRLGRTVEFVRFTGDGHNLSRIGKPRNRILRLRAIAHWLIRHLKPAGITAQPEGAGALFEPLSTEKADEPKL